MGMKDLLPYLMSTAETMKRNLRDPRRMWNEMNRPQDLPNPDNQLLPPPKSPQDLAVEYAMSWGMPAAYLGRGFSRDILNPSRESRVPSNMSRRDFLKQGAGLTAGAVAAKYGLSKIGTPVGERTGKEVAEAIAPRTAAKAAPKYKFNSLQQYLDDVENRAYEDVTAGKLYHTPDGDMYYINRNGLAGDEVALNTELEASMKRILKQDEAAYNTAKDQIKHGSDMFSGKSLTKEQQSFYSDIQNQFSPAAKEQMRELKSNTNARWEEKLTNRMYEENPHMYNYADQNPETLMEAYYDKYGYGDWTDELWAQWNSNKAIDILNSMK